VASWWRRAAEREEAEEVEQRAATAARARALAFRARQTIRELDAALEGRHAGPVAGRSPGSAPVEFRSASVAGVNFAQRIIEVVAVPYEEPALIEYRGTMWNEVFSRGAFEGIERQGQVRVNRNHDKTMTVGKVVRWWPERSEGLVSEVRVAPTDRGEETLTLADEDMLSASVGFAVRGRDQMLDKSSMIRRISKAFVDHLSFVEAPSYVGAKVLAVRGDRMGIDDRPPLDTPNLDELVAFMNSRKV
jgi:hypothetical protein